MGGMNIGRAQAIFMQLDSDKYSENEKAMAIYQVMNMPTHNGINKDRMLDAIRYLWHRHYEFVQAGEGKRDV